MTLGYKHDAPFDSGYLNVGSIHRIYYEQYGKQDGKPALFLHGGPGGRTSIASTVFFDPSVYRVILFDQRGCGKSTPAAEIRENTTQHLITDIESLRQHAKISKWHLLFGGSWGSTLALLYAQTYPDLVGFLVLRGICVMSKWESSFLQVASSGLFPGEWSELEDVVAKSQQQRDGVTMIQALEQALWSEDREVSIAAVRAWSRWENAAASMDAGPFDASFLDGPGGDVAIAMARMAVGYFVNDGWMEDGQLLRQENMNRIRHRPGSIVNGRWDVMCPPKNAWILHRAWPESELYIMPRACHGARESGTFEKLIEVCDEYGRLDLV